MNATLPTAERLEKLPMRAVVAYAAKTARRISSELRGIVADYILDNALGRVDAVLTTDLIGEVDTVSLIRASECVAAAYEDSPASLKSPEKFLVVFSLTHAALAAMYAIEAARDPVSARHQMEKAVQEAQRAVRSIKVLNNRAARAMTEAARQDYDTLLREYGEHEEVVIGDPVDCFDDE